MIRSIDTDSCSGLTYVEVLIAVALISIALIPAMEALRGGVNSANIASDSADEHYSVFAKMEEVMAESHASLTSAAQAAGSATTTASYSDASGTPNRRLVYIAPYDADNADGDDDVYTVIDPNLDGDSNLYSGYDGLLWVRVMVEGSYATLDGLVGP